MTIDEALATTRREMAETPTDRLVERLAERVGAHAGVQAVFGDPIRSGNTIVVPVARARWGVGGGGGRSEAEGASGSGGGGGAASDPIGYLVILGDDAQFRPIANPWTSPLLVMSGAVAIAIVLRALARLLR